MATTMSLQPPASAMPPPPRRQSSSSNSQSTAQSHNLGGSQTTASNKGAGEDVAEEDNDDEADESASDMDAIITNHFRSIAASEFGHEDSTPDDLEQKIFELQASGWRPPEEMADTTEDEDYNAVDLLSDNEEEDGHLRRREEQLLTAEERFNPTDEQALARRLSLSSQGSNDSDLAYLEFNDNFLFSSETPWSQSFQHLHPDNLIDYGTVFDDANAPGQDQDTPLALKTSPDSAQRRVRFEEEAPSDSDDSDSDIDQDLFPDLFVQQDQLDAGFRADIEADVHDLYLDDESETGSCWDFDADEARILMMDDDDDDGSLDSDDSSVASSGYECRSLTDSYIDNPS
ncbi:hypothetical protein BDV97DRAFT_218048 [Delphinella strobiligena]|nr:hypothetical protein BDV97DRAFT_218048 [Delphinella strobiligena]